MSRLLPALAACVAGMALSGASLAQDTAMDAPSGLTQSQGALLRGLDKVTGVASNIDLAVGQTVQYGFITVTLQECRYPANDPSSNAYARVMIADVGDQEPDFSGWMMADSPALSALDHQRYDVWVIRCSTS